MEQKQSISIPMAIIVAGIIVGGAIFMTKDVPPTTKNDVGDKKPTAIESAPIRPVDKNDHILGNPEATIMLVEYSDTECPFCKMFHMELKKVMDEFGKTGQFAWVYRHFPLDSIHPKARKEAEALECANELAQNAGFWKYLDRIFEITPGNNQLDPSQLSTIAGDIGLDIGAFDSCLKSGRYAEKIQKDLDNAIGAGGRGTPFNIFIVKGDLTAKKSLIENIIGPLQASEFTVKNGKTEIQVGGSMAGPALKSFIQTLLK